MRNLSLNDAARIYGQIFDEEEKGDDDMLMYKEIIVDPTKMFAISKEKLLKGSEPFLIMFINSEGKLIGTWKFEQEAERDNIFNKIAEETNAKNIQ